MIRQLAHEIKNPLGGLRGAAQLLARQLDDASMREYTTVIISEADRLVTLVDTLLGPGHAPRKESINIHELLQHVGHLLAADAPPGVVIDRDYDPSLPPLQLDRNLIIQAMLNLGRNAMQAIAQSSPSRADGTATAGRPAHASADQRQHRRAASIDWSPACSSKTTGLVCPNTCATLCFIRSSRGEPTVLDLVWQWRKTW